MNFLDLKVRSLQIELQLIHRHVPLIQLIIPMLPWINTTLLLPNSGVKCRPHCLGLMLRVKMVGFLSELIDREHRVIGKSVIVLVAIRDFLPSIVPELHQIKF